MRKDSEGKPKLRYVSPSLITEVAKVREYGVNKYLTPDGWRITPLIEYLEAANRHILKTLEAYQAKDEGLMYDEESTLPHLAHAATDIMFLIQRLQEGETLW